MSRYTFYTILRTHFLLFYLKCDTLCISLHLLDVSVCPIHHFHNDWSSWLHLVYRRWEQVLWVWHREPWMRQLNTLWRGRHLECPFLRYLCAYIHTQMDTQYTDTQYTDTHGHTRTHTDTHGHTHTHTHTHTQHQAVAFILADMAIGIEASRLCVYRGAWEADCGRKNSYYASISKALASEVAKKTASDAVQVGGWGGV